MLAAIAGPDNRAPNSLPTQPFDYVHSASGRVPVAGRRIAFSTDLGGAVPVDPEVAALARRAARAFESLGCVVEEAFPDVSDIRTIVAGTRAFGIVGRFSNYLDEHRDCMTLQLVQQVRDEAHRFAITGHRARRQRVRQASTLEGIPGLGPARRRSLLTAFGGLGGLKAAGVADLARVRGISAALADRIYAHMHGGLD